MQTALSFRTNRDLFSNYYLNEHLPETEEWEEVGDAKIESAYNEILELWEREKETAPKRNESQLEEKFIRPMFRKLGIPFEVEESTSRTQRRPDYGFFETEGAARDAFERREEGGDFYENAVAVADAKRWGRPLDTRGSGEHERDFENPSYQIHVYLQETPAQWAVLTDGRKWRLYFGPTSHRLDSYYEVDLPTILENGDLEDFKYFYLFFRQEAFLPDAAGNCFLDDVYDESNVFAQELGEDLQDNIYEAIKVLSEGFLQYPENDLEEAHLDLIHDSSLIYLYRLIFVLYAEAEGRELLDTSNKIYEQSYSLNNLKQEVAAELDSGNPKYRDWQDNLQSRLDELFMLIDQGSKSRGIPEDDLYIPAYNGGLFRTDPDDDDSEEARFLANHEVGDSHLARVVELLTRSRNGNGGEKIFVDYSSLDVRHLGSIYEGLLEYKLNVAEEPLALDDDEYVSANDGDEVVVREGEVYLTTDGGERKTTGSYYTPEYVVEYIVENTLGPLVEEIREDHVGQTTYRKDDQEAGTFADQFAERVFDMKILDPAMGSGHFLTSAVDYLAREIIDAQEKQAAQQGVETVDEEHDINWARRKVAQRCIYGVDLNPLAVELAKVSLWLRTLAAEQPLAFLDHHLKTGNSLVGSDIEDVLSRDDDTETEDGQLTLLQSFDHTRQQALEHVMERFTDLLAIDNETLEDIKEMEEVYEEVRHDPLYQHLLSMANVHTADEFGLDVPDDAYERMAEALRHDSWENIESQDWFRSAQVMAEEENFFHWELEYPVAFYADDGERDTEDGFDAIIGNPPYVKIQNLRRSAPRLSDYLSNQYKTATKRFDIYAPFVEKGHKLTRNGLVSYILPNKFFESSSGVGLREYITSQNILGEILDFGRQQVFEGATTYTCVLQLNPGETFRYGTVPQDDKMPSNLSGIDFIEISTDTISKKPWVLVSPEERSVINKLENAGSPIGEKCEYISEGIVSGDNDIFFVDIIREEGDLTLARTPIDGEIREFESELVHHLGTGNDVERYQRPPGNTGVIYPYKEQRGTTEPVEENRLKTAFPNTYSYLSKYRSRLEDRGSSSMSYRSWYALYRPREKHLFESKKLITPDICQTPKFAADDIGDQYFADTVYGLVPTENSNANRKYLLSILNSSVTWFYIYHTSPVLRGDFRRFKTSYLKEVPVIPWEAHGGIEEFEEEETVSGEEPPAKLARLGEKIVTLNKERSSYQLEFLNHIGNYTPGMTVPDFGVFQPKNPDRLAATIESYEKLRIGEVKTKLDGDSVTIYATARYKPENEDQFETDRWGYTETDFLEAFTLTELSEKEAALVDAFIPVAVEKGDGFAGFRENATKTTSLLDRLKSITLPDLDDVQDNLERYLENKKRADELDEKIEKTDQLIDEIVYDLYGLTDEEIEIVESSFDTN